MKDSYNLNRVSIAAGVAALEDIDIMRAHVRQVRATRTRLSESLRKRGYEVPPSQANFVLARQPGRDQRGVYEALMQRRILVRYFATPDLFDALRDPVVHGARHGQAGDVALHVGHDHRHAQAGEAFCHHHQGDGLAGASGAGHQAVAVAVLAQQVHGLFALADQDVAHRVGAPRGFHGF